MFILPRGAHRISIFREPESFLFVLRKVKLYCRSLELTPIAYCLMPNHYHFLIRQEREHPAGLLPQRSRFPSPGSYRDFVAEFLERGWLPQGLEAPLGVWEG